MTLHALDVLGDAVTATRRYRPRGLLQWLWVTVVALLVGGIGIGLPTGGTGGGTTGDLSPEQRQELAGSVSPGVIEALALLVAVLVVVWLSFVVLGALLEFPFLAWLRDGEVDTWTEVRAHLGQALGLAAFRLVVSLLGLALAAAVLIAAVGTDGEPYEYVVATGDLALVFGLIFLPTGVVAAFTTAFVVPTMVLEDTGVLGGWRRFWRTLTDAPKQFAVYLVAVAVLASVGGILAIVVAALALVPGLVVGGIFGLVVGLATTTFAGVVVTVAIGALTATVVWLAVYVLLQLFLRYYALFVLARIDGDLDFLPERRRAVGAGDPDDAAAADPGEADDDGATPDPDPGRDDPQFAPWTPGDPRA